MRPSFSQSLITRSQHGRRGRGLPGQRQEQDDACYQSDEE